MTALTAAEVLSRARDVLAERGWHQGDYVNKETRAVCALGAIDVVVFRQPQWDPYADEDAKRVEDEAYRFLCAAAGDPMRGIGQWNDDPSRTVEDVLLLMKQAEELAREQAS